MDEIGSQRWGFLIHRIIALLKDLETDPPSLPHKGAVTEYCLRGRQPMPDAKHLQMCTMLHLGPPYPGMTMNATQSKITSLKYYEALGKSARAQFLSVSFVGDNLC